MSASPAKRSAPDKASRDSLSKRHKKNDQSTGNSASTNAADPSIPVTKTDKKADPEIELQQSLLRSDPNLAKRFLEALREKPDTISKKQFARQFWSQRAPLLRAHAIEREQRRASYNVLSEVKPRNVEGAVRLSITPEQVEDIFRQHPVVRRAYDENVPNNIRDNMTFWGKFFVSRLFKRLKGEKITDADDMDPYLDKYLSQENVLRGREPPAGQESVEQQLHIPHFIDLEGNEQNHSQRKGNAPDFTMRPQANDKVPIMRILNNTSEKIMARVEVADRQQQHAPVGLLEEDGFDQLRLQDLAGEEGQDSVPITIKDQNQLRVENENGPSQEAQVYGTLDPRRTLSTLRKGMSVAIDIHGQPNMDLASAIGFKDALDTDQDDTGSDSDTASAQKLQPTYTNNNPVLRTATKQIKTLIDSVSIREMQQSSSQAASNKTLQDQTGLPDRISQDLLLTLHTTNEFLSYFWSLMLPLLSQPNQAIAPADLSALLPTLNKSLTRLTAVATAAEDQRQKKLKELKMQTAEADKRLRKRMMVDEKDTGPGGQEIEWLVRPMIGAVQVARSKFHGLGLGR